MRVILTTFYSIFTLFEGVEVFIVGVKPSQTNLPGNCSILQFEFLAHQDLAEGFVLHVGQVLCQGRWVQVVKQQRRLTLLLNARGQLPLPLIRWAGEVSA